jgi:hypothetical protein
MSRRSPRGRQSVRASSPPVFHRRLDCIGLRSLTAFASRKRPGSTGGAHFDIRSWCVACLFSRSISSSVKPAATTRARDARRPGISSSGSIVIVMQQGHWSKAQRRRKDIEPGRSSLLTLRWREGDSNFRSPVRKGGLRPRNGNREKEAEPISKSSPPEEPRVRIVISLPPSLSHRNVTGV